MIEIGNDGALIASTNYWDSGTARAGLFFLSWNAGAARLLVPDNRIVMIDEMRTARDAVVVSRGRIRGLDAYELLFDDGTDEPFSLIIDERQSDRAVPDDDKPFEVAAWTRDGLVERWPGLYRVVRSLPCLDPWRAPIS